ncbi:MAG: hypothetical protein GX986_08150 [Firmicutes bacterium]|nr:hypothetical protein [Bacillota bacterium]
MEGLFGIVIILYVVGAVVGAVLKRMQQGPILDQPVFIPPAKPGEKQQTEARELGDRDDVVVAPAVAESPTIDGQLVETFEVTEEAGQELDKFDLSDTVDEDMTWEMGELRQRRGVQSPGDRSRTVPSKAASRTVGLSATDWRRAVVLAEVLGKPRGLKPYSLPHPR